MRPRFRGIPPRLKQCCQIMEKKLIKRDDLESPQRFIIIMRMIIPAISSKNVFNVEFNRVVWYPRPSYISVSYCPPWCGVLKFVLARRLSEIGRWRNGFRADQQEATQYWRYQVRPNSPAILADDDIQFQDSSKVNYSTIKVCTDGRQRRLYLF